MSTQAKTAKKPRKLTAAELKALAAQCEERHNGRASGCIAQLRRAQNGANYVCLRWTSEPHQNAAHKKQVSWTFAEYNPDTALRATL